MNPQIQPSRVIEYLQAHKGKHFESAEIAKAIGTGPSSCRDMLTRLVGLKAIQTTKDGNRNVYFIRDGELPETRSFVQKPYKFPPGMIDRLTEARQEKAAIPSKTNTDDAGELNEMDKNKLRMMGAGN
jgi:hypothetical protein